MAGNGAVGFCRDSFDSGRSAFDEKAHGGYLEKFCGYKAAVGIFRFWDADLSVYLFCGNSIFQRGDGNGAAVLIALADFGDCLPKGKAYAA